MDVSELLPNGHVVRIVADRDKLAFALLLGAGSSKSSGVPLAAEMIAEWRETAWRERAEPGCKCDAWYATQPWYKKDNEYSLLFELLYLDPPSRQKYIETKIKDAFPGWGYLYLANIIGRGRFNVIFTTNFDDLINDALTIFLGYNPVVCAADSEVSTINITTDRAKIIKLHGDYLFQSLKNTAEELEQLDPNMERKLKEFATQCGIVALGYAGRDQSVMRVIEELMKDARAFPHGIYWGVRPGSEIAPRVKELATTYPRRFHLFQCPDFDFFMARLHDALRLELPDTILHPYQALETRYERLLVSQGGNVREDPTIQSHVLKLGQELKRPWATAKSEDFDLLQAQLAIGRRDYRSALELIAAFVAEHPDRSEGMATWGDALAVKAEEESSDAVFDEAVAKWREAIKLNPAALPPRYSLARHYARKQKTTDGIAVCEELLKLVPNDAGMRRNLVQLYGAASRYDDAQRELNWLLQREPGSAELHAMRASFNEQCGLVPEAIEELRTAVKLAPPIPWYHFALASALAQTNRSDEAIAEFEEAIRLDARNLNFRIRIATYYTMLQRPALALPHLQAAVSIGPQSAEARGWLCQTLLSVGNFAEAQAQGEWAVRLSPRDSRIHSTVGMAYLQGNRPDLAEQHFQAAMQLNPGAADSYCALCWVYRMQNRVVEFNMTMQQLMRISPQAAQMLQMQLQTAQNAPAAAAANWQEVLQNQWRSIAQRHPPTVAGPPPLPGPGPQQQPGPRSADRWEQFIRGE